MVWTTSTRPTMRFVAVKTEAEQAVRKRSPDPT